MHVCSMQQRISFSAFMHTDSDSCNACPNLLMHKQVVPLSYREREREGEQNISQNE